jgi:hypothetical protein
VLLVSSPNRDAYPAGNPHHVSEFVPDELRDYLTSLFSNVKLYRQDSLLASTISEAETPPPSDLDSERELPAHFGTELAPGAQPYFLIAASNGELPTFRNRAAFGDLFEVKWWEEEQRRLANLFAEAQANLAKLKHEVELVRTRARKAETALLKLEAERAVEIEQVEAAKAAYVEAHETIQAMHQTKVWRLGAAWWGLRARLSRRG